MAAVMPTRFNDYIGIPFLEGLLPIMPIGATLSPSSKIDPSKIGKIPGEGHDDGWWVDFAGWQNHKPTPGLIKPFDRWFADQPREMIGWENGPRVGDVSSRSARGTTGKCKPVPTAFPQRLGCRPESVSLAPYRRAQAKGCIGLLVGRRSADAQT